MSSTSDALTTTPIFPAIFEAALKDYTKKTGKDLHDHPFASRIDSCDSPDSILDILQEQAREFDEFRKGDTNLFRWLNPIVRVLYTLSTNKVLKDSASSVSPATFVDTIVLDTLSQRCFHPQRRSFLPSIPFYPCVSPFLSPPNSPHPEQPVGQGREGKLRYPGRYI